jgi:hypothetical protein
MLSLGQAVAALGGQALFLAAAGWLIKSLVSHRLTKEADAFKANLQSDADSFKIQLQSSKDVEIERLRASLQQVATEHEIRFAKLHEKRALVIAELYMTLVEAKVHAGQFIFQGGRNPALAERATAKVTDLYKFISLNRIYLPESVCTLVDNFEIRLRTSVLLVDVYWNLMDSHPTEPAQVENKNKAMVEACDVLESEAPTLLKQLEREFRELLGERRSVA